VLASVRLGGMAGNSPKREEIQVAES
jgi:hypothetical protein